MRWWMWWLVTTTVASLVGGVAFGAYAWGEYYPGDSLRFWIIAGVVIMLLINAVVLFPPSLLIHRYGWRWWWVSLGVVYLLAMTTGKMFGCVGIAIILFLSSIVAGMLRRSREHGAEAKERHRRMIEEARGKGSRG